MSVVLTRKRIVIAAVIAACALAVLLADWLYVSPEESIRAIIDRMVDAAAEGDALAMMEDVAPDYLDDGVNRKTLELMAQRFFLAHGPTRVSIRTCAVTVQSRAGVAEISLNATVSRPHFLRGRPIGSNWRIAFIEQKGRWRVDRIIPLSLARDSVTSIAGAARYLRIPVEPAAPPPVFDEPGM